MKKLLVKNIGLLATPEGKSAHRGEEQGKIKFLKDAWVLIEDGIIASVGTGAVPAVEGAEVVDAEGHLVTPGLVDAHTHLIFGGWRQNELGLKLHGASYLDIQNAGGGIQSTTNATRQASEQELAAKASKALDEMMAFGTTTCEAKSGYGLATEHELKALEVIKDLNDHHRMDLVATFMGAHLVPAEYKSNREEYVRLVCEEMMPKVKEQGIAKFCDVFCEKEVFELEDSRRLLQAARALGYKLKLHADEIVQLGGAGLAAELKAVSADHLLHVNDADIKRMAEAGVVATLLPLTAFALREPYAPARKFIEAGCAVALATDLNPGSCFSGSIPLTIALACIYMKMSVEEVITAMTLNGAAALDMADITGSLEEGKFADMAVLRFDNYNALPYYVGMNCVKATFKEGFCTYSTN